MNKAFQNQLKLTAAIQLLNRVRHALMRNESPATEDLEVLQESFDLQSQSLSTLVLQNLSGNYSPVVILSSLFLRCGITRTEEITAEFLNKAILDLRAT